MHIAVQNGDLEVVKVLIEYKADVNKSRLDKGDYF